ncbi:hypothetical protein KFE25_007477 [Diacronema lutheri]|uniref:Uncharacterized protein n=1 Tax=Diacronema lutheri TaxID=2081491 RepID=A0A8J5XR98_DIALT|nr:hypothetical protein KFE25_007477 [Diacronema lutheri]
MVFVLGGEVPGGQADVAVVQRELRLRDAFYRRADGPRAPGFADDDESPAAGEAVDDARAGGATPASRASKQAGTLAERQRLQAARAVRRAALEERRRQDAADAERELEYWPARVQKGARASLQLRKTGAARAPPPRAGEHPRSLLAEGERVHGPSKGLPIWNAGTLTYEPYAMLSADLAERPNFHLHETRARGGQPFRVNYPLPTRRSRPSGITHELVEAHAAAAAAAAAELRPAAAGASDGGGDARSGRAPLGRWADARRGGGGAPASPRSSVGVPTTLAGADAPAAYLCGRVAYSSNRREMDARIARPAAAAAALRARPPVAGAIAPRASPPDTAFRRAKDFGDVPLSLAAGAGAGPPVRWIVEPREVDRRLALAERERREGRNAGAAVDVPRYSCEQLLVLCCEGVRELEPTYHLLALHGASSLIEHLSKPPDPLAILPLVPQLVAPLRTALSTRQPMVVAAALKLLQQLACCGPRAAKALLPGLPSLLPLVALWVGADLRGAPGAAGGGTAGAAKAGEIEWAQHRRANLGALTDELLEMLARECGPDGARAVRSFVPTWSTAAPDGAARVPLAGGGIAGFAQRGFGAPARGRAASARAVRDLRP